MPETLCAAVAFPVVLAPLPHQLPHFHCCALIAVKAFDLKAAGKIHKCFSVGKKVI